MNTKNRNIASFVLGFAIMLFSGVFYAWSLFRVELQAQFPEWSASAASLNLTVFIITFCLGGLLGGRLTAKLGQPRVARIGAVIVLAGGLLFLTLGKLGAVAALWMMYLSYGGLCGLGVGMIYNANISAVGSLFPKAGGLVSGALLTGFGLGSLIMGAIVMKLAGVIGFYPAFLCGVVLVAAVSFFGAPLLTPAEKTDTSATTAASAHELTTGQMLKTPVFWLFFLWVVFMTSGGLMVINSAASIALLFGAAAIVGMIVSVFNGLSRTFIGAFCDRFGSSASLALSNAASLLAGVSLLIASFTGSAALMVLGLITAGITYGCAMSMNAVVIREQFGSRNYPSNFSIATLSGIPASIIGPLVSGMLQDASGGYQTTFIAMIVIACLAAAMLCGILVIRKKAK
ncbi:MAG: MFS transporter [Oscillospiraceae bacterium]